LWSASSCVSKCTFVPASKYSCTSKQVLLYQQASTLVPASKYRRHSCGLAALLRRASAAADGAQRVLTLLWQCVYFCTSKQVLLYRPAYLRARGLAQASKYFCTSKQVRLYQ
jgi:hypothetical protein